MQNKRSRFKDIQRFKEIAEILNITFEQAEELFWKMNEKPINERYKLMEEEEQNEKNKK